ncbi:MAG: gephyrin-like molybdotransferase Glp, partial [Dermatophilaceae bacterium]
MRSVAEHRAAAVALVQPVAARSVPLDEALGLIAATDIRSPIDLPRWDNAAMDGYAVRRCDVLGAGRHTPAVLNVIADLPAGSLDTSEVIAGTAARIMTGAPLPPGGDAVVAVEDTDAGTATVQVMRVPAVGANVRRRGEDVRVGDLVVDAGMELGAAQIAAIASLGHATVEVHRPKVGVVSTGSELVDPGMPLPRGRIPDSNSFLLAAAARAAGADVVRVGAVPDDAAALYRVLADLEGRVDLVITSGGVSVGAYDLVKQLLGAGEVEFVRVAMQPGKPQGLGRLPARTPVLCLP